MKNSSRLVLATAIAALAGGGYWYANTSKANSTPQPKVAAPVPVAVATAQTGEMPILFGTVGRAEAYEGVTLKSRIDGQVLSVAYTEGQQVKQGDVLIRLDPADFNAKAMQAEALLAKDQAQLSKAHADVERYLALKAKGFVSDEKVNEIRTSEAAAAATVQADKAALELARLQLSYATIRAPFSGVIGARLVFPGSSVKTNDTALAVVNRVNPLYVTFSVPEKLLPKLRLAMSQGPMKVQVNLPGNKEQKLEGTAKFIDNAVDAANGTILMKAILDNKDGKLTPGQFLNVGMTLDKLADAVLIPNEAIQQGADGNFLYVVKPDNTAEVRKIEVISTYQGMSAITQGIAAGDKVVTDGQLRLTPGATIKARQEKTAEAASPATPAAAPTPAASPAPSAR